MLIIIFIFIIFFFIIVTLFGKKMKKIKYFLKRINQILIFISIVVKYFTNRPKNVIFSIIKFKSIKKELYLIYLLIEKLSFIIINNHILILFFI